VHCAARKRTLDSVVTARCYVCIPYGAGTTSLVTVMLGSMYCYRVDIAACHSNGSSPDGLHKHDRRGYQ
jgi:hypothetical protein